MKTPSILVSYVHLKKFLERRDRLNYRGWVLDSGAYVAFTRDTVIDIDEYIEICLELIQAPDAPREIFALDVIGDYKQSIRNTDKMWEAGIAAIPTFHVNEPEDYLKSLADNFPKIALGGVARCGSKFKAKWAAQCFARIWPKQIHGFGFGFENNLLALPFHTTDASTWEYAPCAWGRWNSFGNMSVRDMTARDLRPEIDFYMKLEDRVKRKFKGAFSQIDLDTDDAGSIRLVYIPIKPVEWALEGVSGKEFDYE